ncbi:MAG: hypothetical protein ACP5P2_03205 [Candidatus Micrarchaeia archaeon]|jgi:hypothetical protein
MAKKDLKKKLEQFKRTQDINKIVERGNIEGQALLESAGEDRPAEASHAYDLISENEGFAQRKNEERQRKKVKAARPKAEVKIKKAKKRCKGKKAKKK